MATRRSTTSNTPNLADLEGATNPVDVPGITPPPGVEANVETRVRYTRMVDPEGENYSDNLRELAADEFDNDNLPEPSPQDPYSEFVNTWRKYHGYPLKIVRLPDPADKRMPGHTFNSPCFELTMLSDMPFDPNNLIGMLQVINNNSGGVFRVFLTDEYGRPVPGARLERLVISDPPRQYSQNPMTNGSDYERDRDRYWRERERERTPVVAAAPVKSEMEVHIEGLQRQLFERVMMRALDPPPPPTVDPLNSLPENDRLALSLLKQGDLLSSVVERIAALAQAPERIESNTWKDKLADAGVNLVMNNPAIVTTATDIISRAVTAIATAFAPRQQIVSEPVVPVQPIRHPPAQRVQPQIQQPQQTVTTTDLPETPEPEDEDDLESAEIDMMEDITKLLLSDKPLSFTDPAVVAIREDYPEIFDKAMAGIVATPSMMIIQYLCSKSDFCADMFNSPRHGAYLRERLEELKALIKSSLKPQPPAETVSDDSQEAKASQSEPA